MELKLAEALVEALNAVDDYSDARVYKDYSGRGMYGSTTAGITGTSTGELTTALLTVIVDDDFTHVLAKLRECDVNVYNLNLRTDSLGRSEIIY